MTTATDQHIVAWVDGRPMLLSEIESRLTALRTGRMAAVLPAADTAEGRNMRRWVVQLCAAERIVRTECAGRTEAGGAERLSIAAALQVGGVAAAILNRIPAALTVVPPVEPAEEEVRRYYERNRDLYPQGFEAARTGIRTELSQHRRVTDFARWLDRAMSERVALEPGFEHPAEPGHPDSTHRH